MSDEDRLTKFLSRVRHARWQMPPPTWNVELRQALSESLVKVGFGGVLELTGAGIERCFPTQLPQEIDHGSE